MNVDIMNENTKIKLSENELAEIKMLQNKFQESIYKLGSLQIEKMELDRLVTEFIEKEKKLKEEWSSLQKLDQSLLDKIVQVYGEGNLNMSDGTFTPVITTPKV
jgi:regulator of replication initiation timing